METRFLEALCASLEGRTLQWNTAISEQQWQQFYHQAEIQNILPLIFEAVYSCPAKQSISQEQQKLYRRKTMQDVMLQTIRTEKFMEIEAALRKAGVTPLIVKGIICRSLYRMPDHRPSSDEDLLIREDEFTLCHQTLLEQGMSLMRPEEDIASAFEVSYGMKDSPLHIEVHKQLFSPDSDAYGELNRFFEGVWDRAVELPVNGTMLLTMGYTDQLLYLICHAFKHFLHSGFGLRQVCDITLFANQYGSEIDWQQVLECCQSIRADRFAATLFRIGRNYLTFQPKKAHYPKYWRDLEVNETAMLDDLFASGVFGASSMSRKHSSTITLNEVAAQKQGKRRRNSRTAMVRSIFPKAKDLKGRYPYLEDKPFLLPVAWVNRMAAYHKETKRTRGNSVSEAVAIGDKRMELMKKYGILE